MILTIYSVCCVDLPSAEGARLAVSWNSLKLLYMKRFCLLKKKKIVILKRKCFWYFVLFF